MIARRTLLLLPLLAACEELRTPQPGLDGILVSTPAAQGPLRAAVEATAVAFAREGQGLAGRPADAALALARFEALTIEAADRNAFPTLSPSVPIAMRVARDENRAALGIAQRAPAAEVVQALARAAERLRANDARGLPRRSTGACSSRVGRRRATGSARWGRCPQPSRRARRWRGRSGVSTSTAVGREPELVADRRARHDHGWAGGWVLNLGAIPRRC